MVVGILLVFIIGYAFIALEGVTKVNKSGVALLMSVVCWSLYMIGNNIQGSAEVAEVFSGHVASTCETILFLMGAMTIVEVIDSNGGFNFVTDRLHSGSPVALLWKTVVLTFFLSALLDNMTTCIVMIMVLRRLVCSKSLRLLYAGIVILAANAGGAFSPIGDVTTIMLWIKGCVTTEGIIGSLFLPSLVNAVLPALILTFILRRKNIRIAPIDSACNNQADVGTARFEKLFPRESRILIFCIGLFGLMFVPVFRELTGLPPFVGVMGVLAVLWIVTEVMIYRDKNLLKVEEKIRVSSIIKKIDISTILFFLGILLTVGALQETGMLGQFGTWLNDSFHNPYLINSSIGILSSVVDNVPLVASAMGMYDIQPAGTIGEMAAYCQDGTFWELLAYCAGTGGSLLIIGSAAGVVTMGLENITFGWYLKNFTLLALAGYIGGIITYSFLSV
ncbi:MAG: sodium:proton antiporter NhaD [Bacteroidaceae bacterium]|nr:sodium:proton antiporter NhaD [Bacteroidaceae bacterium]